MNSAPPRGEQNIAPIPAEAPDNRNKRRSRSDRRSACAMPEPMPAPTWATGPSCPALPPLPIVIAEVSALSAITRRRTTPFMRWKARMTLSVPWPSASGA